MIIGIGGVSRSGKSVLSGFLKKQFGSKCIELHLDNYAKDSSHYDFFTRYPVFYLSKIHKRFNMEHPNIIDFDRLYDDIFRSSQENEIVIAEGFLITYDARIKNLLDKYVHILVSKNTFVQRRLKDFKHSNVWYANHVWDSFMKYGTNYKDLDHIIIDGDNEIDIQTILKFIGIHQNSDPISSS
jgi:uridine kinase